MYDGILELEKVFFLILNSYYTIYAYIMHIWCNNCFEYVHVHACKPNLENSNFSFADGGLHIEELQSIDH